MSAPANKPVWHVIDSDALLEALRRVQAGEDAEIVYLELYVNSEGREIYSDDDAA